MADVEKLQFTCCGCFKVFAAKSGEGRRIVNCPYCGQVNEINTGEPKPKPAPEPKFPPRIDFSASVYDFPNQWEKARSSPIGVGDDLIVHFETWGDGRLSLSTPAKITKFELGTTFLSQSRYFDFAFKSITGKDFYLKSSA